MVILLLIWTKYFQPIFQPILDSLFTVKEVKSAKTGDDKLEELSSNKSKKSTKAD
uniref:Uncharacterized protein n=1 Tax=Tetranychus urticae TaxID=32264 RepID=T1JV59_TETUR